jgi:hypothetical protein
MHAKVANGMLSVSCISFSIAPIDKERKNELAGLQVEDLFAPMNVSGRIHPLLSHLRENDMERDILS